MGALRKEAAARDRERADFGQGDVRRHIVSIAAPMAVAQLVQILYSVVNRIYIGHISGASSLALTGIGLSLPVVTIVLACANLFGMGGVSLCSIARGQGDDARAERIMGNAFFMIVCTSLLIMGACYGAMEPLLRLFGASDASLGYAEEYLRVYLIGTPFVMLAAGMNGFINAQGFSRFGMATVMLGAVMNIALDPILIFVAGWGVAGAALGSVVSQAASAAWALRFLAGKRAIMRLTPASVRPDGRIIRSTMNLGMFGFVFQASNGVVQAVCSATLKGFGGDLFIGVMTVLTSVREVAILPMQSLANAAQPVIGFNYGAKNAARIKRSVVFITAMNVVYAVVVWGAAFRVSSAGHGRVQLGGRIACRRRACVARVLFRLLHDGAPFGRAIDLHRAGLGALRDVLFAAAQGVRGGAADAAVAARGGLGCDGRVLGRADLQLRERAVLLRRHGASSAKALRAAARPQRGHRGYGLCKVRRRVGQ